MALQLQLLGLEKSVKFRHEVGGKSYGTNTTHIGDKLSTTEIKEVSCVGTLGSHMRNRARNVSEIPYAWALSQ